MRFIRVTLANTLIIYRRPRYLATSLIACVDEATPSEANGMTGAYIKWYDNGFHAEPSDLRVMETPEEIMQQINSRR
ncbi:MAG: hypothetical protein V4649_19440 [Bacteroidota bacterium]